MTQKRSLLNPNDRFGGLLSPVHTMQVSLRDRLRGAVRTAMRAAKRENDVNAGCGAGWRAGFRGFRGFRDCGLSRRASQKQEKCHVILEGGERALSVPSRELQTNNSEPVSQHGSPLRMKPSQHRGPLGSTQRSPRRTYPQAIPQGNLHRVRWALVLTKRLRRFVEFPRSELLA